MVVVEHGGDAVEAEAVEAVLLQPPAQVRQQVAEGLWVLEWREQTTGRDRVGAHACVVVRLIGTRVGGVCGWLTG